MAKINHVDDFTRGRMIGKLEEGRTVTSVAAEFGINKSVASRAWKACQTTGTAVRKLKIDHRRHRLQWCREHKNWTTVNGVVSSLRMRVGSVPERFSTRLTRRDIGTRFYTSNIKERHYYAGPGVLVWGGIMLNGRTELHIFDRGSVIGDRYCEEVLLPHVRLFRGAIGPDFIFMDDNARPHRTLAVEELLESEDITRMD
ncbi:transposable element Tcb2 transposase [Trichonephila clavipes]|nr:transposable element Tcb2 transposase [Trichonephila clavipes]